MAIGSLVRKSICFWLCVFSTLVFLVYKLSFYFDNGHCFCEVFKLTNNQARNNENCQITTLSSTKTKKNEDEQNHLSLFDTKQRTESYLRSTKANFVLNVLKV